MPFVRIAPMLGIVVVVFALTMRAPLGVALGLQDGSAEVWVTPMALALLAGAVVWGLGEVGPAGNFAGLTAPQLWLCTLAMLMGRLEMLSLLVLFTPGYWRK